MLVSPGSHQISYYTMERTALNDLAMMPTKASSTRQDAPRTACIRTHPPLSRRDVFHQLSFAWLAVQALPACAAERRGIGRYIKKKALDPLVTYVPAVIQARDELVKVGELMAQDPTEARIALRSGAFEGLRDNVRALGEYAASNQRTSEQAAKDLVAQTFGSLQDYDFELFQAIRNQQPVQDSATTKLQSAVDAFDKLLATVPLSDLSKAKDIVEAIQGSGKSGTGQPLDIKQLQQLVPSG